MRILLVGGGSGGHVYPLIAVAEELQNIAQTRGINLELRAITNASLWASEFSGHNIPVKQIFGGKLRRYSSAKNFLDIFKIMAGFFQSLWHIFWYMPDVLLVKGGYSSLPPALAGRFYFIPIFIHESDADPGLANRLIAKVARQVFIGFHEAEGAFGKKAVFTGNPIRRQIFSGTKQSALSRFQFQGDIPVMLFLGGSQGAQRINQLVIDSLVELCQNFQVIHQTGYNDFARIQANAEQIIKEGERSYGSTISRRYRIYPFLDIVALADAYALSEVVVSRAGANNLSEIAALQKAVIVIPIPQNVSHDQIYNARAINRFGAIVLEQENLTPHILLSQINYLMQSQVRQAIQTRIGDFAVPDAGSKVANNLVDFISGQE